MLINTLSGKQIDPLEIRFEDIDIWDIAHALSQYNRFGGHTILPISVAQHSVFVSLICSTDPKLQLQGLLHDAAEAYLGDVVKPLKDRPAMESYRLAETRALRFIMVHFGCPQELDQAVELADWRMARYEFGMGYPGQTGDWPQLTEPERHLIELHDWAFWSAERSKAAFLNRFFQLTR